MATDIGSHWTGDQSRRETQKYNVIVKKPPPRGRAAIFVATGILVSRLAGLVRTRFFAHYFGLSDEGDAFAAGFRIPNFLQNLFGEGALSASFIPVYAALLSREDEHEADRVAGAIASILALLVSSLVLLGVLTTPLLIDAIAPGFTGAKRELTIQIVRVLSVVLGSSKQPSSLSACVCGAGDVERGDDCNAYHLWPFNTSSACRQLSLGIRCRKRVAIRRSTSRCSSNRAKFKARFRHGFRSRQNGRTQLYTRLHQPRRSTSKRVY
jgi:hypothetical protein